jgi:SET domain-containing protein
VNGTKPSLLQQLGGIKTRIGRSPISGVGVFAILPIGKRVNPFPTRRMRLRKLPVKDLSKLPSPIRQLVHDYFAEDTGGYMIPDDFGAVVDLESLINHSDSPNLRYIAASGRFRTRPISVGEELTIDDYRSYTTIRV